MPYTIEFNAAQKRIAILVTPPVSEYDALKCFREVRAHPEFRADFGILINLLAADRSLSPTEAEHIGGAMAYRFPGHSIALLRRPPALTPALDALRAAATSKTEVRIFSELSGAEVWLARQGRSKLVAAKLL
jgi:hypothetical protein